MRSPTRSIRSIFAALLLGTILGLVAALPAWAHPSTVDPVFGSAGLGLRGSVRALAMQPDGKLLVAGGVRHLVRLNTDGTLDTSFHPRLSGSVNAMAVQRDGRIILAGNFGHVDHYMGINGLVRLYPDGKMDPSFNSPESPDFRVGYRALTIALQRDGKILVGGFADNEDKEHSSGLVRLNHDGTRDTSFKASIDHVAGGPSDANCVYAVQVQSDDQILIGGIFTKVDGVARSGFARLDRDGSLDTAYAPAASGTIGPGALQADDKLLVTGTLNQSDPGNGSTLVRLNRDGSVDLTFNYGSAFSVSFDHDTNSLTGVVAAQASGQILVANPYAISSLNPDGTVDASFHAAADDLITWVLPQTDGTILLGGFFSQVNGFERNSVARLQTDGSTDPNYVVDVSSGPNGTVYSMAVQSDGKVVIGGAFTELDGVEHQCIARLNSDGTPDGSFNPILTASSLVFALQSDGKIVLGGSIDRVNGITSNGLTRLNPDGSVDTTFNAKIILDTQTNPAIIVQADGKILVGSDFGFTSDDVLYPSTLTRLNADGSVDGSFNADLTNIYAQCMVMQIDGKILLGGQHENGALLIRLNTDGSVDAGFNVSFNRQGQPFVNSIAVQADGKILVGGAFYSVNGVAATRLVRLNGDGSVDPGFKGDQNDYVQTVIVEADGTIVIGTVPKNVYFLNSDGTPNPFAPTGTATDGPVNILVPQPDGKILIGGNFSRVDGELRDFVAELDSNGTPDFFGGWVSAGGGFYYLQFAGGTPFGYYNLSGDGYSFPYFYHADLGMEYFVDARDGQGGAYLYDFASSDFFYTSPGYAFPYLYDFNLQARLYYYPDPNNPGHYNTDGIRYFYNFATGQIITK